MTAAEIFERMIASGGVNADALRVGGLTTGDWSRVVRIAGELVNAGRIWVDDAATLTIAELRSRARRWRANEGKGDEALVCVDYLQLVKGVSVGKHAHREQEVAEVSRGLKALAKDLKCPVIALAQLNRAVENRADKRPTLSDLRESGQIEQDADVVAFLYREEIANPRCTPEQRGTAELIVAKGRGMPVGTVMLSYESQHVRFRSAAPSEGRHWSEN